MRAKKPISVKPESCLFAYIASIFSNICGIKQTTYIVHTYLHHNRRKWIKTWDVAFNKVFMLYHLIPIYYIKVYWIPTYPYRIWQSAAKLYET